MHLIILVSFRRTENSGCVTEQAAGQRSIWSSYLSTPTDGRRDLAKVTPKSTTRHAGRKNLFVYKKDNKTHNSVKIRWD